jgi:5-(carboxyamino)imidazole ribonucleotide synthase
MNRGSFIAGSGTGSNGIGPVLPGKTIGILGGGQLGRMFAIAARRMGYRVHAFDPAGDCPTGQVADVEVNAAYDDVGAARRFAEAVDVVTFEFENIPAETLAAIEAVRPVRPSAAVLDTCRHRLREKTFLSAHGFTPAEWRPVRSAEELSAAVAALGTPCVLKTADFGYDGKGQTRIDRSDPATLSAAWAGLGRPVGVLEKFVAFDEELSVIVARSADGRAVCFPPFANDHRRHILDVTTWPADLPAATARAAEDLARAVADALGVVGLLTVEMFRVGDRLLVNELAPRPHNSGHVTFDAAATSQFEQQLRAVCGLPLGDPSPLRPAAMANLLGDVWAEAAGPDGAGGEPDWAAALSHPAVKLHLYGKSEPRIGRKMGHLSAVADTPAEARRLVLAARDAAMRKR